MPKRRSPERNKFWPCLAGGLDRLQMLVEHHRHLGWRDAAEAAIGRKPELRQEFPRQRDALLEAIHMMDDAEIDPRAARLEVFQRRKERDRKSTRLNSSHVSISYAVFC